MKYLIRILTLPFIWLYAVIGISISYLRYGLKCFTMDVDKIDSEDISEKNKIEIYVN